MRSTNTAVDQIGLAGFRLEGAAASSSDSNRNVSTVSTVAHSYQLQSGSQDFDSTLMTPVTAFSSPVFANNQDSSGRFEGELKNIAGNGDDVKDTDEVCSEVKEEPGFYALSQLDDQELGSLEMLFKSKKAEDFIRQYENTEDQNEKLAVQLLSDLHDFLLERIDPSSLLSLLKFWSFSVEQIDGLRSFLEWAKYPELARTSRILSTADAFKNHNLGDNETEGYADVYPAFPVTYLELAKKPDDKKPAVNKVEVLSSRSESVSSNLSELLDDNEADVNLDLSSKQTDANGSSLESAPKVKVYYGALSFFGDWRVVDYHDNKNLVARVLSKDDFVNLD